MIKLSKENKELIDGAKVNRASRLDSLRNHVGWDDLLDIFRDEYQSSLTLLLKQESVEARLTLSILEKILQQLDNRIVLGNEIVRKYLKQKVKGKETNP